MANLSCYGVVFLAVLVPVFAFDIYWNVPSQQCKWNYGIDLISLLSQFGVLVNDGDKFQGGNITIFYDGQLGLYPKITKTGKFENGGIPQRANLDEHLKKTASDLQTTIPNPDFKGLGIIDWEAWRPAWDLNWSPLSIYQEKSKEYVKELDPSIDPKLIPAKAKSQWEESAKTLMLETLLLAKKSRRLAKWCYYLFPDCYNYEGEKPEDFECSKNIQLQNDKISWLWQSSTAVCPSVYLYKNHLEKYSLDQRTWKDNGKLKEAIRVANPKAKIFPYVNYFMENKMLPEEEFERIVAQVASVGGDGVVIWGSSSSVGTLSRCKNLKNYIIDVLGPVVEKAAWRSRQCTKRICSGRGKCTWPKDASVNAWKLFQRESTKSFYAGDILCKCEDGFQGRFCENKS